MPSGALVSAAPLLVVPYDPRFLPQYPHPISVRWGALAPATPLLAVPYDPRFLPEYPPSNQCALGGLALAALC